MEAKNVSEEAELGFGLHNRFNRGYGLKWKSFVFEMIKKFNFGCSKLGKNSFDDIANEVFMRKKRLIEVISKVLFGSELQMNFSNVLRIILRTTKISRRLRS